MREPLTYVVVGSGVPALPRPPAYYALRDRLIDDKLLAVAALLEVGLLVMLVLGLAGLGHITDPTEKATFVAYLVSLPLIPVGTSLLDDQGEVALGDGLDGRRGVRRRRDGPAAATDLERQWLNRPAGPSVARAWCSSSSTPSSPSPPPAAPCCRSPATTTGRRSPTRSRRSPPWSTSSRPGASLRGGRWVRVGVWACTFELVGVLVVGTASYLVPDAFPDKTVWSHFGQGYGFVPLVLPVLGLLWFRKVEREATAAEAGEPDAGRPVPRRRPTPRGG